MNFETAIDLSVRSNTPKAETLSATVNSIVRPTPRPPWTIVWYQNLLPAFQQHQPQISKEINGSSFFKTSSAVFSNTQSRGYHDANLPVGAEHVHGKGLHRTERSSIQPEIVLLTGDCDTLKRNNSASDTSQACSEKMEHFTTQEYSLVKLGKNEGQRELVKSDNILDSEDTSKSFTAVVDVACCDGPVHFERVSNPNFAVTVEHHNSNPAPSNEPTSSPNRGDEASKGNLTSDSCENRKTTALNQDDAVIKHNSSSSVKTYLCIYCNQSFKSLFCYQKHKKRHLNPVSVDITGVHASSPVVGSTENRVNKTKDLNVQFFPCKKCGCKFPSYYFVHKHKKICH